MDNNTSESSLLKYGGMISEFLRLRLPAILLTIALAWIWVIQMTRPVSPKWVVNRSLPAVVSLGNCSGFVASPYGHIVTAAHCIKGPISKVWFLDYPRPYRAKLVYASLHMDYAILQVPNIPKDVPWLTIDDSSFYLPGEPLIAIGSPLGLHWTVTSGILSKDYNDTLQFDMAINPGNSGGPIINEAGKVVALCQRTILNGEGLSFGIPGRYIRPMLEFKKTHP